MKEFIFKTPLLLDDHRVVLVFSYGENIQSRGGKVAKKKRNLAATQKETRTFFGPPIV